MRVMVTGAFGYIGSVLSTKLHMDGVDIIPVDVGYFMDKLNPQFRDCFGDCRSADDLAYRLHFQKPDAVIHLAGIVGEAACKQNPVAHYTTNVFATEMLANLCVKYGVRDFIYVSSCSVYGNTKGMYDEVTERTPVQPLTEYAHAKAYCDKFLMDFNHPDFHPTILRLTTVFGNSPRLRLDLVTNMFIYQAWKNKQVVVTGGGGQYRSLIHVEDVVDAIIAALKAPRFIRSRQIFHVGEERNNLTVHRIAAMAKEMVPGAKLDYDNSVDTDRRDYRINCQKIKNCLNWNARWSVMEGMKNMLEFFNANPSADFDADTYRNDKIKYL